MENEIKVNDFVRTKDGQIYKIEDGTEFYEDSVNVGIGIIPDVEGIWVDKEHFTYVDKIEIVKHSTNLIDLIQCGDYVNGKQVSNVDKVDNTNFIEWTDGDMYKTEIENDKFIETIVTKEQFESISYKVERNN